MAETPGHSPDRSGLKPQSSFRRRLIDAAFILPAIGAVLILIPGIWPQSQIPGEGTQNTTALTYLFAIWCTMISLAAVLAKLLQRSSSGNA